MRRTKRLLGLWVPPVLWMGVIFGLSSISDPTPPPPTALNTLLKKGAHVVEYAVLAGLLMRAQANGRSPSRPAAGIALGISLIYAVTDEAHQRFVVGRHGRPWDVLIDLGGALLGLAAWQSRVGGWLWKPRIPERRRQEAKRDLSEAAGDR